MRKEPKVKLTRQSECSLHNVRNESVFAPEVRLALRSYNYAREYFLFLVPIASVPLRASCDGNFGLSGGCAGVGSVQFDSSLDFESLLKPQVIPFLWYTLFSKATK